MTEPPAPVRIAVLWSPEARADLRAIAREPAMQVLYCLDRYLTNHTADVKKLRPPLTGFRLRCGDYRVFFDLKGDRTIEITALRHRKEALICPQSLRTGSYDAFFSAEPVFLLNNLPG